MGEKSPFMSRIPVPIEEIRVNHNKTQKLLRAAFMHGQHDALKEHLKNNPVHQNFYGSLEQGIELVISGRRTMSEIAPTLILLLQNDAKWACNYLLLPGMKTPYHVICRSTGDHQELLELMSKKLGLTSVNVKDDKECTALMYAVRNANIGCVKCLIANGADVNVTSRKPTVGNIMDGPLIDSIRLLRRYSYSHNNIMMGIFDLLLDSGADVNKPCFHKSRTPIMYASALGNVKCVKKLVQKGAQVDYTDRAGQTSWTLAAHAGSVDVLKCLLEDNCMDKNSIDYQGLSILYWAVASKNIEALRYLLKQGVTMKSFVPQEYVESCTKCRTNLSCYSLSGTQLHTDPYVLAIRLNMLDVVKLMDKYGCELGKSPEILSYAIRNDCVDVVEYLLCNYKYPLNYGYTEKYNVSRLNSGHQTFLNKACENQSVKVIKLLVEHGAEPNKPFCVEKCPKVTNAVIDDRHVDVIACFIRGGVTMNTRSCYPEESRKSGLADIGAVLPFEAAVHKNHIYVVEMLLVSGCSRGIHSWNKNHKPKAKIEGKMQELLKEWNVHKNYVLPLKQRCRMAILNHLCPQADKKITELPLPPQIIKYLSIPELDEIVKTFKCKPLMKHM